MDEREFWVEIRRALMIGQRAIELRYALHPPRPPPNGHDPCIEHAAPYADATLHVQSRVVGS